MALAATYQLGRRGPGLVVHQIDWSQLTRAHRKPDPDPVEERIRAFRTAWADRIRAVEALPDPGPPPE